MHEHDVSGRPVQDRRAGERRTASARRARGPRPVRPAANAVAVRPAEPERPRLLRAVPPLAPGGRRSADPAALDAARRAPAVDDAGAEVNDRRAGADISDPRLGAGVGGAWAGGAGVDDARAGGADVDDVRAGRVRIGGVRADGVRVDGVQVGAAGVPRRPLGARTVVRRPVAPPVTGIRMRVRRALGGVALALVAGAVVFGLGMLADAAAAVRADEARATTAAVTVGSERTARDVAERVAPEASDAELTALAERIVTDNALPTVPLHPGQVLTVTAG